MKYWVCIPVLLSVWGCDKSAADQKQRAAYDKYLAEGVAQNREFARQLEVSAAQQLKAAQQNERYDSLLDKWEEQARRMDALLERWAVVIDALEERLPPP